MKIAGAIIQKRMIREHTDETFEATYKGSDISITSEHGHGEPEYPHLTRYDIDVRSRAGEMEVSTYKDFHSMSCAIRFALKGACLIP